HRQQTQGIRLFRREEAASRVLQVAVGVEEARNALDLARCNVAGGAPARAVALMGRSRDAAKVRRLDHAEPDAGAVEPVDHLAGCLVAPWRRRFLYAGQQVAP